MQRGCNLSLRSWGRGARLACGPSSRRCCPEWKCSPSASKCYVFLQFFKMAERDLSFWLSLRPLWANFKKCKKIVILENLESIPRASAGPGYGFARPASAAQISAPLHPNAYFFTFFFKLLQRGAFFFRIFSTFYYPSAAILKKM